MSDSVVLPIVVCKLILLCEYFNFNSHPSHYDVYSSFSHAFICSESDYSSNTMPPVHPGTWNQIKLSFGSDGISGAHITY